MTHFVPAMNAYGRPYEHFCDYHGTWSVSPVYNHRNVQTWVINTELSGHDVSNQNLWDNRETRLNFPTVNTVHVCL